MKCPKCGYEQLCPCPNCKCRAIEGIKPWIWDKNGEIIECAGCGHKAHADWWEEESHKQYKQALLGKEEI